MKTKIKLKEVKEILKVIKEIVSLIIYIFK